MRMVRGSPFAVRHASGSWSLVTSTGTSGDSGGVELQASGVAAGGASTMMARERERVSVRSVAVDRSIARCCFAARSRSLLARATHQTHQTPNPKPTKPKPPTCYDDAPPSPHSIPHQSHFQLIIINITIARTIYRTGLIVVLHPALVVLHGAVAVLLWQEGRATATGRMPTSSEHRQHAPGQLGRRRLGHYQERQGRQVRVSEPHKTALPLIDWLLGLAFWRCE